MMTRRSRHTLARISTLVALSALLLSAAPTEAHQPFRVDGTISTFENRVLVVKTREGESFTFRLQESTTVRREKNRVSQTELRPGRRVDVHIMADSLYDQDPFVLSVELAP
ncbi:MAG: hypothetical protein O2930_10480 [Acidobacteria bacterium]|nr:hypothetical protein [Acidobacteriota bacterium]